LTRIVVSRSIGDKCASRIGVVCDPDVFIVNIEDDDEYLVVGSDGLWDGISIEEAATILSNNFTLEDAAKCLTSTAIKNLNTIQIDDNVTTLIVKIQF
jgi:protein phosphatase 1L